MLKLKLYNNNVNWLNNKSQQTKCNLFFKHWGSIIILLGTEQTTST
jgi:hypothetical protein